MKKKVNINREKISAEEIAKRRDFNSLMKSYTAVKKPFWKQWPFLAGTGTAVVAAIAVVVYLQTTNPVEQKPDTLATSDQKTDFTYEPSNKELGHAPFINPPLKGVDIPFTDYNVDANKNAELKYTSGSTIKIPKGAFKDANGNAVTGKVDVRYREFHDPVDFFVSGISMTYDSAGTHYTFESAGMVEIYAYQHGKVLKMDPEKFIEIQMSSHTDKGGYNVYTLDTAAKGWIYLGKDQVKKEKPKQEDLLVQEKKNQQELTHLKNTSEQLILQEKTKSDNVQNEIKQIRQDIKKLEDTKPLQPKKVDKKKSAFDLGVDPKEFPEIAVYKGVLFEIDDPKGDLGKITWEDITLSEGTAKGTYVITLTKGSDKRKVTAVPVFEGKNYEDAMKQFNSKFSEYTTKLNTKKEMEKKKQEEYDALVQQIKKQQEEYEQRVKEMKRQQEELMKKQMESMKTREKVFRVFTINNFGVYNCDSPHMFPKGANVMASFVDANNAPAKVGNAIYLVDREKNALFTYTGNPCKKFEFNPKSRNIVWTVTADNELLVFFDEQFSGISARSGQVSFQMKSFPETELTSVQKIKSLLKIGDEFAMK